MATDETINAISATLKGCFPVWARELTTEARHAWVAFMRQYPDQSIRKAAQRLIERHKGPHLTIADFNHHLKEVQLDAQYDRPALPPGQSEEAIDLDEFVRRNPNMADAAAKFRALGRGENL